MPITLAGISPFPRLSLINTTAFEILKAGLHSLPAFPDTHTEPAPIPFIQCLKTVLHICQLEYFKPTQYKGAKRAFTLPVAQTVTTTGQFLLQEYYFSPSYLSFHFLIILKTLPVSQEKENILLFGIDILGESENILPFSLDIFRRSESNKPFGLDVSEDPKEANHLVWTFRKIRKKQTIWFGRFGRSERSKPFGLDVSERPERSKPFGLDASERSERSIYIISNIKISYE